MPRFYAAYLKIFACPTKLFFCFFPCAVWIRGEVEGNCRCKVESKGDLSIEWWLHGGSSPVPLQVQICGEEGNT